VTSIDRIWFGLMDILVALLCRQACRHGRAAGPAAARAERIASGRDAQAITGDLEIGRELPVTEVFGRIVGEVSEERLPFQACDAASDNLLRLSSEIFAARALDAAGCAG
jgi:hypothetical protein